MLNSYIYEGSLVSMNSNQHKHHHHGKLMQHYSLRLTRVHVPKNIKIIHRLHRRREIFLCIKKKWTEAIKKKKKMLYKCITANTIAKRQRAAHSTDQLTSPSV